MLIPNLYFNNEFNQILIFKIYSYNDLIFKCILRKLFKECSVDMITILMSLLYYTCIWAVHNYRANINVLTMTFFLNWNLYFLWKNNVIIPND